MPAFVHEHIVLRVVPALAVWGDAGHGRVAVASGYKVRISERRGVAPDVQLYRVGNASARTQDAGLVEGMTRPRRRDRVPVEVSDTTA